MSIANVIKTQSNNNAIIAEKLPKVYHAGQLNVLANAESLNGSLSGEAVSANDVSSVEHNVGCKVSSKNLLDYKHITISNGTIERLDNGAIAQGNWTSNPQISAWGNGWIHVNYGNAYKDYRLSLKTGDVVTISCDYTLLELAEGRTETQNIGIFLYGDDGNLTDAIPSTTPKLGETVRIYATYTVKVDSTYYPVISLNSNKVKIENIQIEYGSTATAYEPYITDFSSVKVIKYGKNLINLTGIIGTSTTAYGGTLTCGADGGITGSGTPTNSVAFSTSNGLDRHLLPSTTYVLSSSGEYTNIACAVYLRKSSGSSIVSFGFNGSGKSTVINCADYPEYDHMIFEIKRGENNVEMSGTAYFQLELGSTATNYELPKSPTTYTANADGTVDGITSIAPNMTLLTDTDGVVINANYYKDPDIVISNLQQAVAMSGGE